MKKIKSQNRIEKRKIEEIAINLLNSNQKWRNNFSPQSSQNQKDIITKNQYLLRIDTEKDILTLINTQEKIEKQKTNINKEIYINEFNIKSNQYSVNSTNKDNDFTNIKEEEKDKKRKKSQIPKNKKGIVPKIKGLDQVSKKYIDKFNKYSKDEYYSSSIIQTTSNVIENTSESASNYINYDILNQTGLIYEEIKKQFILIQNSKSNNSQKDNDNIKEIYFKCKVLAYDFIQFLYGEEIQKIIKLFNYCLDIGKFIIYQIYLFLSIIYLDENKKLDESLEMSYKNILVYSSQNFNNILNIIMNPEYCSEPKKMREVKMKNKIIISILKLINPNVPTNSKIKEFMNPENEKKQINDNFYKIGKFPLKCLEEIGSNRKNKIINNYEIKNNYKEEINNLLGIIDLITLLKENKELNEKLNQIKNKVLVIFEQKINSNNNNPNNNNIINNNPNNNMINNNPNNNKINPKNNNANRLLLPKLNPNNNYKLFLIFELDETLVHYWEEKDNCFVKVRFGVEDFFNKVYDFCEITIVSTSSKEYTDIVVDNINKKNCYIQNRIYKELFDDDENFDLSLINRDQSKCIFICHEAEFFNAPKSNILQLTEFSGDESDREIIFLFKELMKLKDCDIPDIRQILPEIINNVRV